MTLESLLQSLGLTAHMAPLSDWRDNLLREKAAEIQTLTEAHTAELATAAAALATERTAKEAAQASLQEHQRISDALVTAAAAAIAANDTPTLHQILTEASLFGKAREKAKLEAEHAAALAAAADLQAKLAAL